MLLPLPVAVHRLHDRRDPRGLLSLRGPTHWTLMQIQCKNFSSSNPLTSRLPGVVWVPAVAALLRYRDRLPPELNRDVGIIVQVTASPCEDIRPNHLAHT